MENHMQKVMSSSVINEGESMEIRELSKEEMLLLAGGGAKTTIGNSDNGFNDFNEPTCHGSCHGGAFTSSN